MLVNDKQIQQEKISVNKLIDYFEEQSFNANELVLEKSNKNCKVIYLSSGTLNLFEIIGGNCKRTIRVVHEQTLIGLLNTLSNKPCRYNVEAITDCKCYLMSKSELMAIIKENSDIAIKLLKILSNRLCNATDIIESISNLGTLPIIASYLCSLITNENKNSLVISIPMNMKKLSSLLCMSPMTLSRNISILIQRNYLVREKQNQFRIIDYKRLVHLMDSLLY